MIKNKLLPWFDPEDTQDYFCLTWNLTRDCNFTCPYCSYRNTEYVRKRFNRNFKDTLTTKEFQTVSRWILALDRWNQHRYTMATIFGGEPTLMPDRCALAIRTLCTKAQSVHLHTNLSMYPKWYINHLQHFPNLYLTITYHLAADTENWNIKFISNLYKILLYRNGDNNFNNRINVVVMDGDPDCKSILERLAVVNDTVNKKYGKYPIKINKLHVIHCGNLDTHKKRSLKYHTNTLDKDTWSDHVNDHTNGFFGWTCLAGQNNLYIEENGDVYPCQGSSKAHHSNGATREPYGNIIENPKLEIPWGPTKCIRKKCRLELYISKYFEA